MTELLRHAIAEVEKLSAEDQDAIAARVLTEIDDDMGLGRSLSIHHG